MKKRKEKLANLPCAHQGIGCQICRDVFTSVAMMITCFGSTCRMRSSNITPAQMPIYEIHGCMGFYGIAKPNNMLQQI